MISKNSPFLLFLVLSFCSCFLSDAKTRDIDINGISNEENLELEKQLKMLNKHPVTTFQTKAGVTIDCIKINEQPSLDQPLLKNHKIQMKPKSIPKELKSDESSYEGQQDGSKRTLCPIGTVPIRRTTKQDLIIAKSFHKGMSNGPNNSIFYPDQKVSQIMMKFIPERYFGAKADLSISELKLTREQSSSSNLWIQSGSPSDLNMVSAGIMISEVLNYDQEPRLFTKWTNDGFQKSGCYNLVCQGFVQIDGTVTPGYRVTPDDTFYGQNVMKIRIFQDGPNGPWWLMVGKSTKVGYWPSELFPYMRNGSNHVGWGGATRSGWVSKGTWPPMGNGNMPNGDFTNSAFIMDLSWIDSSHEGYHFPEDNVVDQIVDSPNCYGLFNAKRQHGYYLLGYGGPGGSSCN